MDVHARGCRVEAQNTRLVFVGRDDVLDGVLDGVLDAMFDVFDESAPCVYESAGAFGRACQCQQQDVDLDGL